MIIRLPIDLKSLFYNICNDNLKGHTATVATILKQGQSTKKELEQIYEINERIDINNKADLVNEFIKNSKTQVKILAAYKFNKIAVNGNLIYAGDKNFVIYLKQETDQTKVQYGRIKMHYPLTLKYEDEYLKIDNKYIVQMISDYLYDFAFLVNAFEYDTEQKVLNFDVTIVGINNIPYSKIFINEKGVGNKMLMAFNDEIDSYDYEIVAFRNKLSENIDPNNYIDIVKKYKNNAIKEVIKYLEIHKTVTDIRYVSEIYPYSLYDIEYKEKGIKKYIIVEFTATNKTYFNLSYKKMNFISCFANSTKLILVKDILDKSIIEEYNKEDLDDFNKRFNSMIFIKEG